MIVVRKWLLIVPPFVWLLAFFAVPFAFVAKIAMSDSTLAMPPYLPVFDPSEGWNGLMNLVGQLHFDNFRAVFDDNIYIMAYLNSIGIAFVATLLSLLLGYPIAYAIASAPQRWKLALIMAINLPFWTSFLIRIYAWIVLLSKEGVVNHLLISLGVTSEPLQMLNTTFAVYVGMVYAYLPLMVFPIYATLEKLDTSIYEAARDLGCHRIGAFFRVTLPLSLPGIMGGCFLVFIPMTGEFVIPSLLGSTGVPMIGRVLWDEFFINSDWPLASSISVLLLALLVVPIILYQFNRQRRERQPA